MQREKEIHTTAAGRIGSVLRVEQFMRRWRGRVRDAAIILLAVASCVNLILNAIDRIDNARLLRLAVERGEIIRTLLREELRRGDLTDGEGERLRRLAVDAEIGDPLNERAGDNGDSGSGH